MEAGQQPLALSVLGLVATAMGVFSATTFVTLGQVALGRRPLRAVPLSVLAAMTLTSGLILSNSRAVYEAAVGRQSPFVRTPKMGGGPARPAIPAAAVRRAGPTGIPEIMLGPACSSPWCYTRAGTRPCSARRSWGWPWSAARCSGSAGRCFAR